MIWKRKGSIEWLEFELFADCKLVHGVFLKHGGISEGPFESLNFGLSQGDLPENVTTNIKRACEVLGIPSVTASLQNHGTTHREISVPGSLFTEKCDGMTSRTPGIGLLINHADCQAAIFYDPKHHAVANVHCGWRGNVQNIYLETVRFMKLHYGSSPSDLLVGISPSLGPRSAEFRNFRTELPESFWKFQIKPTYFDLWEISRTQLVSCGILPHHIEIAKLCTYESTEDFFSYRRAHRSGRHATIVALL